MRTKAIILGPLIQGFFSTHLIQHKDASPHTIASYRDTFRLLLKYLSRRLRRPPSKLFLEHIDARAISEFLKELEDKRGASPRTRNLRLCAIRSFFAFVGFEEPRYSGDIAKIMEIPRKKFTRKQICSLSRTEADALLGAVDQSTALGRRDYTLMVLAMQTGLRLSELCGLGKEDVFLGTGAHVRVLGKGRKERSAPLAKRVTAILKAWLDEPTFSESKMVFPNARGGKISPDGLRHNLRKHVEAAAEICPSLKAKRVSPHVLRHTAAMDMLNGGVDLTTIAQWLGHESIETTQVYLDTDLKHREKALEKIEERGKPLRRFKGDDSLMIYINSL